MALSPPAGFSSSDLVFQDDFSGTTLDSAWHTYITSNAASGWPWNDNGSGGSTPGGPYEADYDMPSQVSQSNGQLNLTAIKQPISGINGGTTQTFPYTSGAVSSYGKFEFNGGYLQVSMKAPSGGGAWPALWLLPGQGAGSSGDNFEIDMQEGGFTGSGPANQNFSWHLHTPAGTVGGVVDSGVDLTAGFHTYGIDWDPGKSITWYLDGKQMAQVTSAQVPIPDQPMELIMNNGVANSSAADWHTAMDGQTPSSMQMQVDSVQLYQKAGSGDVVAGGNVDPSTPPSTTPPTPPPTTSTAVAEPVLTIADPTLSVAGRGGKVDLGANVTTTDPNDVVTVNIAGLPKYETITDKLDGKTFSGKNITLTAAQVDSGLTLQSNYRGGGHPEATLTLTATAKDPATGAVATASPQTIVVTDPRATATKATTSPQTSAVTDPQATANKATTPLQPSAVTDPRATAPKAPTSPKTIAATDLRPTAPKAPTSPQTDLLAGASKADHPATGTTTASQASQSFALLNQYLAGNSGRVDPGQIVASVSNGTGWNQDTFLTKPQH